MSTDDNNNKKSTNHLCPDCRGGGKFLCRHCDGEGEVLKNKKQKMEEPCQVCHNGRYSPVCKECHGNNPDCCTCQGTGYVLWKEGNNTPKIPDTHVKGFTHLTFTCKACNGSGKVVRERKIAEKVTCPTCKGQAKSDSPCISCGGTGRRKLGNHIPQGQLAAVEAALR